MQTWSSNDIFVASRVEKYWKEGSDATRSFPDCDDNRRDRFRC
jgi:hypothetical protein